MSLKQIARELRRRSGKIGIGACDEKCEGAKICSAVNGIVLARQKFQSHDQCQPADEELRLIQAVAPGKEFMQKWDYKYLDIYFAGMTGGWKWKEDGKLLPGVPDVIAKAKELGHQGWELVSVYPHSSHDSAMQTRHWFKRPVPEGVPPPLPKA